jgi:hypothetical protein
LSISTTKPEKLSQALSDDIKTARQIINAAKRKLRSKDASSTSGNSNSKTESKQAKTATEVKLPEFITDRDTLLGATITTNRAPLVLAFAVVALSFTPLPLQPLTSRLSLAQGVVALNSRSKAQYLGIEPGKTAEEEGYGEGFGRVSVLGREVRTVRRNDVEIKDSDGNETPAFWAVDLERLRERKFSAAEAAESGVGVPIHTALGARGYLMRAFDKVGGGATAKEKEANLAKVLGALTLVMETWKPEDVHRKAWDGYVRVRPQVQDGPGGWGAKGEVKLGDVLALADKVKHEEGAT